jgi:thiol-disulfide isomerase/thioredoxin
MKTLILAAFLLGGTSNSLAAQNLKVGDPAPAIDIEHWVVGEPISALQPGQAYVVEFWATWCPPCVASMPHLSKMQEKYGDQITFIGVSDEKLQVVEKFLADPTRKDKLHYRITTDPDGSVYKDWFYAAGLKGIPSAFLVNAQGLIEWIGHPMTMDGALAKLVAAEDDPELAVDAEDKSASIDMIMSGTPELRANTEAADQRLMRMNQALISPLSYAFDLQVQLHIMLGGMGSESAGEPEMATFHRRGKVLQSADFGTLISTTKSMDIPGMDMDMEQSSRVLITDSGYLVDLEEGPLAMSGGPTGLMKLSHKEAAELDEMMPMPGPMGLVMMELPSKADPLAGLQKLILLTAFDLHEANAEVIHLRGLAESALLPPMDGSVMESSEGIEVNLLLDASSHQPMVLWIGEKSKPQFQMKFHDFAIPTAQSAQMFELNPDDETVQDLAPILREQFEMMMNMGSGQGFEDEDEEEF